MTRDDQRVFISRYTPRRALYVICTCTHSKSHYRFRDLRPIALPLVHPVLRTAHTISPTAHIATARGVGVSPLHESGSSVQEFNKPF